MTCRALIVDGPFLVMRPYNASKGKLESVIGGATATILDLQDQHKPEQTFCCWEASGSVGRCFGWEQEDRALQSRREIDDGYKAQREPWPSELVDLVGELIRVFGQMGVINVCCEDEADDAIAALSLDLSNEPAIIWSADKDALALVRPGVSVIRDYQGSEKTPVTHENIVARTGLTPEGWTAFLALAGDAADGVAGVAKIAKARALKVIAAVPGILGAISDLSGAAPLSRDEACAIAARTDASAVQWVDWIYCSAPLSSGASPLEQFRRSYQLVRLRPDSPLRVTPAAPDREAAAAWFAARGHSYIARRLAVVKDAWDDEISEEPF